MIRVTQAADVEDDHHPESSVRPAWRREGSTPDVFLAVLWTGVLALGLFSGGGIDLYVEATLAVGVAVATWVIGARRFPTLLTAFQIGFVVIIALEGVLSGPDLTDRYGAERFHLVAGYLVSGLAVLSLAHALVYRAHDRSPTANSNQTVGIQVGRSAFAIVVLSVLYLAGIWPRLSARVTTGRLGTFEPWLAGTPLEPLITGMIGAAGMVLPATIAYHTVRIRRGSVRVAVLLASPVFAAQFAIGTRYPLLFSAAGMFVVIVAGRQVRPALLVRVLAVGSIVFIVSASMTQFRAVGLGNAGSDGFAISAERIAQGDRVVSNMIEISEWFDREGYTNGTSSLSVLLFFIPRTVWPEKPLALGYWFPRRYGSEGFSEGHSIAYSFGGDPYADGGYGGGLIGIAGLGVGIALLDRWVSRKLANPEGPWIIVAATAYGACFFAARSVDTAFIATCLVFVLGTVYVRSCSAAVTTPPAP